MKKRFVLVLVLALALSAPATALAAPKNSDKSNGNPPPKKDTIVAPAPVPVVVPVETGTPDPTVTDPVTEPVDDGITEVTKPGKKPAQPQQVFKQELNEQKKELTQQKSVLAEEKDALEAEMATLLAAGDAAGAAALQAQLDSLNAELDSLQSQIKEIINERYMVVKTIYTDAELAQFENVAALIEQMQEDAKALDAGSVTINNQLIKFDAPAYIKGGDIMVPIKAITEQLEADVVFDEATKTLTITRNTAVIQITAAGVTATIDGSPVDITDRVQVTCGRTFIPLDLLAEILNLDVSYDSDNGIVDVDDPATETPIDDGTTDPITETPVVELTPDPVVPELEPVI
ncbi:stalk domain-containing protein [Acetobacterium sp.]|uniref:copper amine oxidase N-terminal domain-containing protein n=1 Tax=Acetobacterium sp. TaxID=1872094 RepID=UPI0035941B0A